MTSYKHTEVYDSHVVPLLRRMISLKQLMLCLTATHRTAFIDGIHFENEILIHMPRLQKFIFNILTYAHVIHEENQQSDDDIRRTFLNGRYDQVACYTEYYLEKYARSHVYSLPYTMDEMLQINSSFSGGLYSNVTYLMIADLLFPFEHDFFLQISQSFPLITYLGVVNVQPQKHKRSNQRSQISPAVEFCHLTRLTVGCASIDYAEQFLVETNVRLPRLVVLEIHYDHLEIVTENFTRDATRLNCAKLEYINVFEPIVHSKNFYLYFPSYK